MLYNSPQRLLKLGGPGSCLMPASPPVYCELSLIKYKQWKTLCWGCRRETLPKEMKPTEIPPRHQLFNTCLFRSALSFKCAAQIVTHTHTRVNTPPPTHIDHLFLTAESNNRADKLGCHRRKKPTLTVSRSAGGVHRAGFNRHKVPRLEKKSMF